MKLKITGVDSFSGATCVLTRGIKKEKEHVFNDVFITGLVGKYIKHVQDSVTFDIKVESAELITS